MNANICDFATVERTARHASNQALQNAINDCNACIKNGINPDKYTAQKSVFQKEQELRNVRATNRRAVNKFLTPVTGLRLEGKRGDGYFYFVDNKTGSTVGNSIMTCYVNTQTIAAWIDDGFTEIARVNGD